MHFGDRNVFALAAQIVHFQDMEANAGADWADDVAFLRAAQRLREQRWQLFNFAPAHVAAFQRLRIGRVGHGQFTEIGTAFQFTHQLTRQRFLVINLLLGWIFRQRQQNLTDVKFGALGILRANLLSQRIHFLRQNGDTTAHFIVTHFRDQHLFADLRAIIVVVHPVIGQTAAQLINAHAVLRGDVLDRLIQLLIAHLQTGFFAHLQNDGIHDLAFKDLMTQGFVIRQLLTSLLRL